MHMPIIGTGGADNWFMLIIGILRYYIYGQSGPSLLRESTDSTIYIDLAIYSPVEGPFFNQKQVKL